MKKKTFYVYDILWDTDGNKEIFKSLPSSVEVIIFEDDVEDLGDGDEIEMYIGNYLSDEYGYCHYDFWYDEIEE